MAIISLDYFCVKAPIPKKHSDQKKFLKTFCEYQPIFPHRQKISPSFKTYFLQKELLIWWKLWISGLRNNQVYGKSNFKLNKVDGNETENECNHNQLIILAVFALAQFWTKRSAILRRNLPTSYIGEACWWICRHYRDAIYLPWPLWLMQHKYLYKNNLIHPRWPRQLWWEFSWHKSTNFAMKIQVYLSLSFICSGHLMWSDTNINIFTSCCTRWPRYIWSNIFQCPQLVKNKP